MKKPHATMILFVFFGLWSFSAAADDTATPPGTKDVHTRTALASIGSTGAQANEAAGSSHDTAGPSAVAATPIIRPAAGLRALRKMDAVKVIASLEPAFHTCYVQSDSRSKGTVLIRASTTGTGEVETTEILSHEGLPLGVAQCIADRVHEARFRSPGGSGLSVLVPVRFGS